MPQVFKRKWTWRGQPKTSRWYYLDYYVNGRRIIQRSDPKTDKYREALQQLRRALGRAADGWTPATRKVPTVGQVIADYLLYLEGQAPNSFRSHKALLRWWLREYGTLSTGEFERQDVDAAALRLSRTCKPATVAAYLAKLRSAFRRWDKNHTVSQYPIKDPKERRRVVWSDDEVGRVCRVAPQWIADATRFMLLTGTRIGDTLTLKWEQVDLERRSMRFVQQKSDAEKLLPLSDAAVLHLKSMDRDSGVIFREDGQPVGYKRFIYLFRGLCNSLEPPLLKNPHDLRRTFAQRLRDAGADDRAIANALGQTTISMPAVYSWDEVDRLRAIIETSQKQQPVGSGK